MQRCLNTGLIFTLLASMAFVALPCAAEMYKWTDAQGRVHYSDQPPPPDARKSTVKPAKPAAPAAGGRETAAPKTVAEQEAEFRKRRVEAAEREAAEQKAAQEEAEKKRNCEQAQGQLKALQAGGRLVRFNAQGEREYLDDAQAAQEIERATKSVDNWCK